MNQYDRNKIICKTIKTIWSSLDSHLEETYKPLAKELKDKRAKDMLGGLIFHRKCVREYAEMIKDLSEIL